MPAVPFAGQVALVTGAASGIGKALATALWQQGAIVVLADRSGDQVNAAAETLAADGNRAIAIALDVTDADAFQAAIDRIVSANGRLDYLFNNAGIGLAGEVRDMSLADWRRTFEVNVFGVVNGIQAAYPVMIRQGHGHIVNTASGAGLCPRPGMTPYAASKHAVLGLSTSMRAEAAGLGVQVSAVCPGYIQTAIMATATYRSLDAARLHASIPIRPMTAEACARVILRGVRRNRAIIPVTTMAWADWWLYRLSPAFSIWLAQFRANLFRRHRTTTER